MLILSNEQIKKAEKRADSKGLGYEKMMENAGRGCAGFLLERFAFMQSVTVLCGKGRNGGDGFVIARILSQAGIEVTVVRVFDSSSDELSEKKRQQLPDEVTVLGYPADLAKIQSAVKYTDILVDAVFGIGFRGSLPDGVKELFAFCCRADCIKVAIDLPSGLSVNTAPDDRIIKADYTLSMLAFKQEQVFAPHRWYCGETHIIPIGIHLDNPKAPFSYTAGEIANIIPKREYNAHKGSFGRALLIAGSRQMPGAAVLAAKGALSAGAGLTQLAFPDAACVGIQSKLSECIFLPLPTGENGEISPDGLPELRQALSRCSAAAIGCGLGTGIPQLLTDILQSCAVPLIIDADGINILSQHKDILKEAKCPVLLTPHPGEMARLTDKTVQAVNAERELTALRFAAQYGVFVLLKGENTVIASPDGRLYINGTGCTALSRGGSGDLLTGITVSLLAQGMEPFDALCAAAYIHGTAGDIAGEKYTSYAATVERTADCLPDAFLKISESK